MLRRQKFVRRFTAGGAALATGAALVLTALPASPALAAGGATPGEGENIALAAKGGSVTATGQEVADRWGPALVIDGVRNPSAPSRDQSRWSSNTADDASITVELAEPAVIDHIAIEWEDACAAKYKLQVSTDGETFVDATDVITPVCGLRDVQKLTKADTAKAYSHVRMQGLERTPIGGQKYGMSMWEFEVWDGAEPVVVPSRTDTLVPLPQSVTSVADAPDFVLAPDARIVADPAMQNSAEHLADLLRGSTGFALPLAADPRDGDIVLAQGDVTGFEGQEEAYALTAGSTGIRITSATDHGAFNAVQTLRQLFPAFVESDTEVVVDWTVPAVEIADAPRFSHRGSMLDVARSFLTVDEVKAYLDSMAAFKLDTLHFHLADDQGWRLEITNEGKAPGDTIDYSQLTKRSGATAMTQQGFKNELGRTGYYTQEQYKDIVAYAADLHITVIPEIDTPSHTNAALHAIPELNTAGTRPGADESGRVPANGTGSVGYSTMDANSEATWVFLEHVLTQLAAITPGEYIHVGGDESHVTPHDDYVKFITRSVELVHSLDKKMMGWNEASIGGVQTDDAIQYWVGGTADTLDAVKNKGAKLVLSRSNSAYLDMKYNSKTPIGLTWAGIGDFPKYYDWDPATVVTDAGAKLPDEYILGVEGPMWAETIRGGEQAEFLGFPRVISHAEIGWTPQAQRDVTDFTKRMGSVGERLLAMDTNFYDGASAEWSWSAAGVPVAVSPDRDLTLSVATVAAPGTKTTEDATGIAVDRVDDADGVSASKMQNTVTATIDWGDGTAESAATFRTDEARNALRAAGLYEVRGQHSYAEAGDYKGTVTFSDGTVAEFTTTVADGTPDPAVDEEWDDSVTPKVDVAAAVNAGDRLPGTLSGFEPGSYVTITIGDRELGTVRPDEDGEFALSLPVIPETYSGTYAVTATLGDRTASDETVIKSSLVPLTNRLDQSVLSVVGVDSEETVGEQAGAANAIDGDPSTFWHTQWQGGAPEYPHWITLDLGAEYDITGFAYTQRAGQSNGRMKEFEVYVSDSAEEFGDAAYAGSFLDLTREQVFEFDKAARGRYLKLVGLSSISGNAFGGAAEISVGAVEPGAEPTEPTVELTSAEVARGGTASLSAEGLAPDAETAVHLVPIDVDKGSGKTIVLKDKLRTDADGAVVAEIAVPNKAHEGSYELVLVQTVDGEPIEARTPLTVTPKKG
ncbi:family 20 glycosylhydrolase [Microbacterium sp. H1-D42]|uniref:family 20 glycosylhydrolase n=1 Tax=Microbacterium sp. H1-D42 TaxID=2925844 RepID=UPI001F52EF66|nr:family 20 glycosylhydrolase [Microbacterium sp. H1-D42]UNK69930.1 family 20 glycosylhydrolase [Microbacterium sp. H1-D42]